MLCVSTHHVGFTSSRRVAATAVHICIFRYESTATSQQIKVMVEKMEVKGERHFKGGQKKGHKRPVPDGSADGGTKRQRLDATTVSYFRRVGDRLNEGFTEEEEQALFVENVLSEVKGKAALVSTHMTGSHALERLLSLASLAQVAEVLAELGGETGSEFRSVSCDQCGGHVMESALRQAHRWTEESPAEEDADATEEDEERCGMLEAQVKRLCEVVRENIVEFLKDSYGSHVLRTLIQVLAGSLTQDAPAAQTVCVTNPSSSAALQTLLTVTHRKRPILCKQLIKGIMGYLTPLLVFLKDPSCSHLIQTVFSFSHKALLRDVYKNHLRTQLMPLALHRIANFTIQSLIAASAHCKVFLKIFDELMEGFEAILAADHMGVVVQMVESCAHWEEKQNELLQRLLQAFHCNEPASLQVSCLPLFLSLLTYEVYYSTEAAEGDAVKQPAQRSLSICYHGSRLVQALAGFKDRTVLMNSLHGLSSADLLTLGTDRMGSHALQMLVTTASDKGRGKILRKLEELYVQLACSSCGSRLLEAVWNSANVNQRQSIAEKLVPSESQLRSDQFARHVWAKFGLTNFMRRRGEWQEVQTGESKKRKMFNDILQ
ncbi:nucleolar 9 [Labeo rohita]|uniref:Nucleolar 9 n=1 Tax=Labeo rohita TaxID=84645 RepID=A0A498LAL8_LABRO|nr:nucleolar 9 [Labeo rohita]